MINNKIIINNVDVTDCEWLGLYQECKLKSGSCCALDCEKYSDCIYKQFQRQKIENASNYKHLNDLYNQALKDMETAQNALQQIKDVIINLEKEDICIFPDFSLQENMKAVMKQCNKGYLEILNIINKVDNGGEDND